MRPEITVVVTTIEPRRQMLRRALESVYAQTLQPAQIVIAQDNGRQGAPYNRQNGTDSVQTPLVAYLDDDDEFYPSHLAQLARELDATDADLVFPWFDVVGGTDPFPMHEGKPWVDTEPRQIPVTFLARTAVIREVGGWVPENWNAHDPGTDDEGNRAGEDYNLTLRLVDYGAKIVHLPQRTWGWNHAPEGGNTMGLPSRVQWM